MRCAAPAWQTELKSFYCLKINQTSKHDTWLSTGEKKICLWVDTDPRHELYLSYCRACSSAASKLSRIALCFFLLLVWAETFDYIPGEKPMIQSCLRIVSISHNKRKSLVFLLSWMEKAAPCCLLDLDQESPVVGAFPETALHAAHRVPAQPKQRAEFITKQKYTWRWEENVTVL